jgi:hypothetical protein
MLNTTSKIPDCCCPYCGYHHGVASGMEDGKRPCPGAISLCMMCGELGIFDDTKRVRKPTAREMADIQHSHNWPPIEQVSRLIKQFIAMTPEERIKATGKML